ncbi:uncharacterized protein LOC109133695 [Beta vulgaris subsp. vulgaris]|uniref:uncharacterized protein LOC109133695 n=1 Tax=Beta vulgaris subsp. vulgaris TaxID=3555 RepID=UPI0025466588|nr:uncharacterized protein LOC109133695 [Beta vulgaris subsp. vulgaris]
MQDREQEADTLLLCRRLYQQFLVDGYTMIEAERLSFLKNNQQSLRSDNVKNLRGAVERGDTEGSSNGELLDTTVIHRNKQILQKGGLRPEDRPDIICRVFKMKLDQLVKDLKENEIFGRVKAASDIDKIICAELPDPIEDPNLYETVTKMMLHGPCGSSNTNAPCMDQNKCTKHFPKRFIDETKVDEEGYPVYRRRDNGTSVEKNGVHLDNRFVVPYNPQLLQQNSCDDPQKIDEIKMYYDCRYISACEAVWRIYGFPIHYRTPAVERLSFHLPGEQTVVYTDQMDVGDVLDRPNVDSTKFLSWMECNQKYEEARQLTYVEFPEICLETTYARMAPRSKGFALGRVYHVAPGSDLTLTDEQIQAFALADIEAKLQSNGSSLRKFSEMPFPEN